MFKYLLSIITVLIAIQTNSNSQTLTDMWEGRAKFKNPRQVGFQGLHFLSNHFENGVLKAFFIRNQPQLYKHGTHRLDYAPLHETGLATSVDGIRFIDQGTIIPLSKYDISLDPKRARSFTGRLDNTCEGRSANVSDPVNYLTYGSTTSIMPGGRNVASFHLWIDNTAANPKDKVATIDVYSISSNRVLASKDLFRRNFRGTQRYGGNHVNETIFHLNFHSFSGERLEFRVYYHKTAYLCHRLTGLSRGPEPLNDNRMASFPGAWKDGNTWYVAYEAADLSFLQAGKIRYAKSTDGRRWVKMPKPLLTKFGSGYAEHLVGTPTLYKENGIWYLFFHGHSHRTGKDVCSIAYGPDIENLRPLPQGIMPERPWNNGTVCGKIGSIVKEGRFYYMIFEAGNKPAVGGLWDGQWGVGLARATNILGPWEQYSQNPIVGPTRAGLGFDGPEITKFPNGKTYLFYRVGNNFTIRQELMRR